MTETAINDGAKIILWPELAIIGVEEDVQAVVTQGKTFVVDGCGRTLASGEGLTGNGNYLLVETVR